GHGRIRIAGGDPWPEPPGARHPSHGPPAGRRCGTRLYPRRRRLHREALQPHGIDRAAQTVTLAMNAAILSVALVLLGLYASFVLFLFIAALIARSRQEQRKQIADEVRPRIVNALVQYIGGSSDTKEIREFSAKHRDVLEECFLQYHASMGGDSRDRLSGLALDLSLVQQW